MFGEVLTAIVTVESIVNGAASGLIIYQASLAFLLLLTVLFANFAEALAEARKTGIEVDPVPGAAVNEMLARVYATPPAVIEQARELAARK